MPRGSNFKRHWQQHRDEMLGIVERAVKSNRPKMSARSKRQWREHRDVHFPNAMRAIDAARRALQAENFASLRGVPKSGQTGMGPQNIHADEYRLMDPDGQIYEGVNIAEFVRRHAALFEPRDLICIKHTCNAQRGLCKLRPWVKRPASRWKGWSWAK